MRRLVLLALLLTACSHSDHGSPKAPDTVAVAARACTPAKTTLQAGRTVFRVTNDASAPATVAVLVDEDQVVAEQKDIAPGKSADLDVDLSDGHYDLTCTAGGAPVRSEFHVEGGHEGHGEHVKVDREVKVTARDFAFDGLNGLTPKSGDTIRFTMTNAGEAEHELQVYDPDGNKVDDIGHTKKGDTGEVVIAFTAPGTYRYLCAIDDHEPRGMKGTFTVT